MVNWLIACRHCGNEANCVRCITELNRLATSRKRIVSDMKQIGLLQGEVLRDPNETQIIYTEQLFSDLDTLETSTTDRLPRQ